jgi:hypothetical protein
MATGPQDGEVLRCVEPMDAQGAFGKRLGKASARRVPIDKLMWMLNEYGTGYSDWNVKHFHEHLQRQHNFRWSYTWVKTQLHTAGLVERNKRRGVHRRKRPRKPCVGMMLHQDASRFAWLKDGPELDLVVTMDDATSEISRPFSWRRKVRHRRCERFWKCSRPGAFPRASTLTAAVIIS